ncbi:MULTISPECIES: hypothetical protein [unclassified Pseudomonas]|uniref:hypothetical protein n=1 Tax=unclassified Pseudomonas TaxID=196821 RepID=UPI0035BEB794
MQKEQAKLLAPLKTSHMIKELIKILPPPSQRDASGIVWGEAEKETGAQFPKDFKAFVEVYGGGLIDGFVWVLNPFSNNSNISFKKVCIS